MKNFRPYLPHFAVWMAIALTALGVWLNGSLSHFIPCTSNCGETFDALQYADNYRLYGFKYALVQDMATSPDLAAHPFFYTHNVNLAGLLFALLNAVGLKAIWLKQFVTLLAFSGGLFYVFRTTAAYTRSFLVGFFALLFFCTEYEHILSFGLNALRAWHWLPIFGLLFHIKRWVASPSWQKSSTGLLQNKEKKESQSEREASIEVLEKSWLDAIAIAVFAIVAFGIGYDFWIVCFFISLLTLGFNLPRPWQRKRLFQLLGWIVLVFAIPVVLRQIQIAAVLGIRFWALDLYYSVAIKVSLLGHFLPLPTMANIDRFYQEANVLRPPASPASSLAEIWGTFRDLVAYVTLPTIGLLTVGLTILVGLIALLVSGLRRLRIRSSAARFSRWFPSSHRQNIDLLGAADLLSILILGIIFGLIFFKPISFHIYLKHQFPLIIAPFLLAKAIVLTLAIQAFGRWRNARRPQRWIVFVLACVLVADHAIVQIDNVKADETIDVSWIDAVRERKEASFAVSWIPNSVSVFTNNWVVGIPPGKERDIFQRIREGKAPFQFSDYFLFGERDRNAKTQTYLQPDYWLYFPTDRENSFDRPAPTCRQDYLTATLQRLRFSERENPTGSDTWVSPSNIQVGNSISLGGKIKAPQEFLERVELVDPEGRTVSSLIYNCQQGRYFGTYQIPLNTSDGVRTYRVRATYRNGKTFEIAKVSFSLSSAASSSSSSEVPIQMPQPSIEDIISNTPNLQIADRGSDYAIFDLHPVYSAIAPGDAQKPELLKTTETVALYLPETVPLKAITVGKTIATTSQEVTLKPGDVILRSQQLWKVNVGRATPLSAREGQSIRVRDFGPWDEWRRAYAGLPAVFREGKWRLDSSNFLASNPNPKLTAASTAKNPIPGFWISPGDAGYEIERLRDETGDFVRIRATKDVPYLVLTGQTPLPDLENKPVALRGTIRAKSSGKQVLTLFEMVSLQKGEPHTAESEATEQWTTLVLSEERIERRDRGNHYSVGLYDVKAGDWFDVRELGVYIGRLP